MDEIERCDYGKAEQHDSTDIKQGDHFSHATINDRRSMGINIAPLPTGMTMPPALSLFGEMMA
jgi:hypothetical protein